MNTVPIRRLVAEVLGTMILVGIGCAGALSAGGLTPLVFGLALAIAVLVVGPVSGAHVNPTVTLALALRGRFPWREVPAYVVAQLVGGFLGALLVFLVYGHTGALAGLGATHINPAASSGAHLVGALIAEAIGTFLLCYTVISLTDPERTGVVPVAFGIGFSLAAGAFAFGALTGGSFNFARTLGPELMLVMGGGKPEWGHIWIYLIGPAIGAALAAYLHGWISGRPATAPAPASDTTSAPRQKAGA
jgi:glycerol uptake facilitator